MIRIQSILAICAALTLGASACKSENKEVPADKEPAAKEPAAKEPVAGAEDKGAEEVADAEPAPADEEPVVEAKATDIAGTYKSGGMTLAISNVTTTQLDYRLSSPTVEGDDDPCGGIDYKGSATFDASDPAKATTDNEEELRFAAGSVNFEPSMDMIGNDCARQIDVEFTKSAT